MDPTVRPVPDRPTLLFDGECGLCTLFAEWLLERLRRPVAVVPWQHADLAAHGVDEATVRRYAVWVAPDGAIARGHQAIGRALVACGGAWKVLGALLRRGPLAWLARPGYRVVARLRGHLPGATPACRRESWPPGGGGAAP